MESFVFNNFKYKLINGEVSSKDTWYFWPVKKNFVDDFEDNLKYFKTSADFSAFCPDYVFNGTEDVPGWKNNPEYWKNYLSTLYPVVYKYKPMNETDVEVEPEYVSDDSIDFFISRYPEQKHLKQLFFDNPNSKFFREVGTVLNVDGITVNRKIGRGFYYVRTAEELRWCAKKVNGTVFDNKINIVLGDNIGTDLSTEESNEPVNEYNILDKPGLKIIDFSIGSNPAQPFEGILFGNGFRFRNIRFKCRNSVNGIVSYLGQEGIIDSIDIYDYIILECDKEINIEHLISDGNDVSIGFVCGKNNGIISNIRLNANVIVNKFIPRMYSVTMKGTESDDAMGAQNNDAYVYYPDYLCYNNPGNIVPYIGYFNEGVFATFSAYDFASNKIHTYWSTEIQEDIELKYLDNKGLTSPIQWYYWNGLQAPSGGYILQYTAPGYRTNVLFYDSNMFSNTNMAFNDGEQEYKSPRISTLGLIVADPEDPDNGMRLTKTAQYFDRSIKMNQQNRVAYYVSPIVGINNKTIDNVVVSADIKLSGSFAGFMGGLVGKQNKGEIKNTTINATVSDMVTVNALAEDKKHYANNYTYYLRDYMDNDNYWFPKRSIKNIGGVIGSLVITDLSGTIMNNVKSNFINANNVIIKTTDNGFEVEHDDYYFLNRYGGIASMIEYNSCNVTDIWNYNGDGTAYDDVNNILSKTIFIQNSIFQYSESAISVDSNSNIHGYTPNYCKTNMDEGKNSMLGTSSPTFGQIKPTYLSVPSLIETVFFNNGGKPTSGKYYMPEHGKLKYIECVDEAVRTGLFTMDQHLAGPFSDPLFWCINLERDLPGISNTVTIWKNPLNLVGEGPAPGDLKAQGYAGGVIDRVNKTYGANFDLDVQNLAGKIVSWQDDIIIHDNSYEVDNPFSSTVVPQFAKISAAKCSYSDSNGNIGSRTLDCSAFVNGSEQGVFNGRTATANMYEYNGNKFITQYPYFGSDIEIIQSFETLQEAEERNLYDTINPDSYSGVILSLTGLDDSQNRTSTPYITTHTLYYPVSAVTFEIDAQAFKYAPFTKEPLSEDNLAKLYNVYVTNGSHGFKHNENVYPEKIDGTNNQKAVLVELSAKFNGYDGSDIQKKFNYATSGFIFYVDRINDDPDHCWYNWYVIPFDPKPLSYYHYTKYGNITMEGSNPPYCKFKGCYLYAKNAGGSHTGKKGFETQDFREIEFNSVEMIYNTYYFDGYNDDHTEKWGSKNQEPALRDVPLTGYKWSAYDGVKMFQLATNPEEGTLDVTLAATGYVNTDTKVGDNDWLEATDGISYPCYAGLDSDSEVQPADAVKMYAVELDNIVEKYWNWQNYLVDYNGEDLAENQFVYDYEKVGKAALTRVVYDGPLVKNEELYENSPSWMYFGQKGKFRNALLQSNPLDYTGITISASDSSDNYWSDTLKDTIKEGKALDPNFENNEGIRHNLEKAAAPDEAQPDFYKFSYDKFIGSAYGTNGITVDVEYDVFNDKAGYWYHNADNDELVQPTDGKVMYYPNVFNIGKTLNQETILYNLKLTDARVISASGFSADDFEGLYVTDSKRNPVMYIDVGLGECKDGTSWSFSGYPNGEDPVTARENVKGLMLEID